MSNEAGVYKTGMLIAALLSVIIVCGIAVFAFSGTSNALQTNSKQTYVANAQPSAPAPSAGQPSTYQDGGNQVQDVYLQATGYGYDKGEISVKKGIPVRFHFTAENAGCGSYLILDGFDVRIDARDGKEHVAEFTPQQEGTYMYHCGMYMFRGNLVVTSG